MRASVARLIRLVSHGRAASPPDYPYSSAGAHLSGRDDKLVRVGTLLDIVDDWRKFLLAPTDREQSHELRLHERTGWPLGSEQFVAGIEALTGITLRKQRPAPKNRWE